MTSATTFRSIFAGLMIFVGVFWAWTVGLMVAWPWSKDSSWGPELRVLAVCADKEPCSIAHSELASAKAAGKYSALLVPTAAGETSDSEAWVRWTVETDKPWQIEMKRSSWHFETSVRYRLEGANRDTPILVQSRTVDGKVIFYALPLALFTMVGLFFRRLRKKG
jgi:hypothetical protein